jgi:dihydroxy-acid dehydratase
LSLVKNNVTPRDIISPDSFYNAVAVDLALGGSTNTTLHLPAIAHAFDCPFDINLFDELGRLVPHLCDLSPIGNHHIEDLHEAGGVYAVMSQLTEKKLIKNNARSVYEKSIGDIILNVPVTDDDVIRPMDRPYHQEGGLAILHGNLAPQGSVSKIAGIPEKIRYHKGPAVVFENGEIAAEAILNGKVKKGDVVVIRFEGPRGGPGMREMLSPTSAIVGMGLIEHVALLTDGRFSGGSTGNVIGHISPEAADNGPIAAVRNGDTIEIDINSRTINLLVPDEEIHARLSTGPASPHGATGGILRRYAHFVQSANTGAVFKDPK